MRPYCRADGFFFNLAHKPSSEHLQMRSVSFLIACMEGDAFFQGLYTAFTERRARDLPV